jgi:hypothetical protein
MNRSRAMREEDMDRELWEVTGAMREPGSSI